VTRAKARSRARARALGALLAALVLARPPLPASAQAVCTCGLQDGVQTLAPITLDGVMGDWAPVLADPDNVTCDGPIGGLIDRDAPVQSTGRDLVQFAYTWDATNLYLFTGRSGSSNNVQRFIYYADVDNDGLMETNEPVIGVNWQGNTGLIEVYLFQYVALAAGGDSMVDGLGFSDGYTLPGGFQNVPQQNSPTRTGFWGDSSNLAMEFRVTWAELGLAPATPFTFHVSSSNSYFNAAGYPSKIDDNLGGCGGGPGVIRFDLIDIDPDRSLAGRHGEVVVAAHTITNRGTASDVVELSSIISGDHTPILTYYRDVDGSGTLTPGDTPVVDTDGDSTPDTGVLAAGATFPLLIAYEIGNNSPWDPSGTATIVTSATSSLFPGITDSVTDTVDVILEPDLLVMKLVSVVSDPVNGAANPFAIPGATVEYSIQVTNTGGGEVDLDTLSITDPIPVEGALFVGDIGAPGSGPASFSDGSPTSNLTYTFLSLGSVLDDLDFSSDGGLTYTYTPVPDAAGFDASVTHLRLSPKGVFSGATAAGNPAFEMRFRMQVN
jgi:uncharacterized repeat protein (TIGR01451 family)